MENKVAVVKENKMTIALGENNAIVKMTENGAIRAVRANVSLSERNGELVNMMGKVFLTGPGYYKLNKVASVSFHMPEKLELPDGQIVVNPYPIIDPSSQTIRKVWVRETGVGRNELGNIQVVTITLLYDINVYFIDTMMKKIEKNKNAGRLCMESTLTDDEKRNGIFIKIDGEMGLWANLNSPDAFDAIKQFIQDKKFAERKAQTVIERNIIKKITGVTYVNATGPDKAKTATVPVTGWTNDLTKQDIEKLVKAAQRGESMDQFNGQKVVFENTTEDKLTNEDLQTSVEEDETRVEGVEYTTSDENTSESSNVEPTVEILLQTRDILGAKEFDQLITKTYRKPIEKLTKEEVAEALKLVSAAVDAKDADGEVY